ncbi:MAG TPA: ABC-F family ATP-binding cassette domain-containing protein, partial [Ktedonobacterales bacterium]|nr:ABC-F family ATP-binding cassette domain-containing protein [Ktedonobacterales bacterium]
LDQATAPDGDALVQGNIPLDTLLDRYGEMEDRYQQSGGYEAENECAQLLRGLGMANVELDRPMAALSGGQKTKVALARLLFAAPDVLMLDEPTNHLDGKATRWLMEYLARFEGAVLLISHDLALLDHAIGRIWHLDATTRTLTAYTGNYTSYQRQRKQNEERALSEMERKQDKIAQLQTQADWMRGKTEKMARRAKVFDHMIEKMQAELPDARALPKRERVFTMDLPIGRQSGHLVLRVDALAKSYGSNRVFSDLSFEVERGQRLVVIGQNGAGKTTLLRVLAGILTPTDGNVRLGHNVDLGYYAQEHELLHPDLSLLQELRLAAEEMPHRTGPLPPEGQLRGLLGRFLFSGQQAFQRVGTLSGGEKTRLALARLMLGGYNTLLLDEPTNNLDVVSREHVLKALAGYRGTLVVVSHDTDFVDALDPEFALLLPAGVVRYFDKEMLSLVAKT